MPNLILQKQNPWWESGKISMKFFQRTVVQELIKNLSNEKILALVGSRQVGKTSILYLLIEDLLKTTNPLDILYFNLDDIGIRELLKTPRAFLEYVRLGEMKKIIFLDEVQRLENPGLFLKTLYDLKLSIKIVVSGSSQLEMRSKLKEFLVGRVREFEISRLTILEMSNLYPNIPQNDLMADLMLYGGYPEVAKESNLEEKKLLIRYIHQTYLQKDISDFSKIENIDAFHKLLILMAAQIGDLVNVHALARAIKLSVKKVEQYLDILEGTFIIKRIYPFFRNYKKEITKMPKIYFLDLGLRNFLLTNWQSLEMRNDKGKLFENFVFLELYSSDIYKQYGYHFWRTTNQTEIDFVIEDGLSITAIEAKFGKGTLPKSFLTFKKYYPEAHVKVVTPQKFSTSIVKLNV